MNNNENKEYKELCTKIANTNERRGLMKEYIANNPRQENVSILKQYKNYCEWCKESKTKPFCYGVYKRTLIEAEPNTRIDAS